MTDTSSISRDVDVRGVPGEELAALLRVSTALASTLHLPEVMQIAITAACELLRLDTGAIYLIEGTTLALGATIPPLPPDFPDEYRYAPLRDHPHIERSLATGDSLWISDTESELLSDAERGVCESRGLRSVLYAPLAIEGRPVGTFIVGSTADRSDFDDTDVALCRTLAHQISLAVANAQLHESLRAANEGLAHAYDATLAGWALAMEMRDKETKGHAVRVETLTLQLAEALGVSGEDREHVRRGALLHDIGKMVVPDAILQKPGPLTDDEWRIMRQHPESARSMLAGIGFLERALDIPYCHHERWDGTGYPQGLAGEQIPLAARIFAIVDVYDALTSDRPYRDAWSHEDAVEHIAGQSGKHFDPVVTAAFLEAIEAETA